MFKQKLAIFAVPLLLASTAFAGAQDRGGFYNGVRDGGRGGQYDNGYNGDRDDRNQYHRNQYNRNRNNQNQYNQNQYNQNQYNRDQYNRDQYNQNQYNRNHGDYNRNTNQGGIGPGKGALIGGGGGALLGAIFGGGLKGSLIGGAAGAGIGAIVGKVHQNHQRNQYYNR